MAKTFVPIIIILLLFGLFAVALINAGIMIGNQNEAEQNIGDNAIIKDYYESVNQSLIDSSSNADSANQAFSNSSVSTTGSFPYVNAVSGIWKVIKNAPITVYNLTIGLLIGTIFGDSVIVWATLSAIIILIIVAAIVKWITQGEGG